MSLWLQSPGKLYLPPPKPVAKIYNTDDYVKRTGYYFHVGTERLLLVGNPYFDVEDNNNNITTPKVSANQYRVLKLQLPDPNKFAIADNCVYNPQTERLVWKLTGIEIGRGGPLGIGATGHPLFNKFTDLENPSDYPGSHTDENDYRKDIAFEPKQVQMFIVGCVPPTGQYWEVTKPCNKLNKGDCPAIELLHTYIQDGDMCEIGFGNANFQTFQEDKAGVPLEITNEICLWPDFLKMTKDVYGDQVFFFNKKEQLYARHYLCKAGIDGDTLPLDSYLNPQNEKPQQQNLGPYSYYSTPSGSLVSSDAGLFNRPYWLHKALGANNGILWGNNCFVTIVDNTRNVNFNISVATEGVNPKEQDYKYKAKDFKNYTRHTEEYELELIVELCKVPLEPDILAHINVMNPRILENWELNFVPPAPEGLQDTYRYLSSNAIKCPADIEPPKSEEPWDKYIFWTIDLTNKMSSELNEFSLGKRFLYQTGMINNKRLRSPCAENVSCKRSCTETGSCRKSTKRKRTRY
uniref:Major capsid protein L1 n=1 Tax=Human papillomavirus TaxID=10566 RepID=A0A385PLB8_9PAPI|nr:MAG: L1 protein [Human papillomavirus]